MKVIISGGGTGGHIFPAIAIANAVKDRYPEAQILFVGAQGRMEMEKVPAAGYTIKGLPIAGLQRKLTIANIIKNMQLPFKMAKSRRMVKKIIREFQPDIVVGVGGFASEPTLKAAASMGYPTLLQEQNSYAGLTNKMLAKSARTICVAYDGMEKFFPKEKIVFTGKKETDKVYTRYTGYPGGQRFNTPAELRKKPFGTERILKHAVKGMLPKGPLGRALLNNLYVYEGTEHPHEAQKPKAIDINQYK